MAFGISAGAISLIGAGAGLIAGGKKGATNQVQSNEKSMDPSVRKMYFGEDGNSGLLGDLNNWYSQNKSGINPDMQAGLNHMKSVYQSPLATQGYERMGNVGYDLMGRGIAENPFLTGNMPNFGYLQGQQQPQFQTPQMPQFTRGGQAPQPPSETPQAPQQQQVVAPVAQTANLGLSTKPQLSLSDNWAQPAAPVVQAPAAPAVQTPTNQISSQEQFQQMYAEEMRRRQELEGNSASSNWNTGYGA